MEVHSQRFPFLVLGILTMLAVITSAPADETDLARQRAGFLAAEEALEQNDGARYRQLKNQLKDYPLYPYLEFQELSGKVASLPSDPVNRFLSRYGDTPLANRLRLIWLNELAKRGDWQDYLSFYQPTDNATRQCFYLRALIETGRPEGAWPGVEPVWLSGHSRPDACDPVFDAWRQAGKLTTNLVWQRIDLAMAANRTRLAKYLGRFLPSSEQGWLETWLAIHKQPQKILDLSPFEQPHRYREKILLHGLKRLARSDTDAALSGWDVLSERYSFNTEQRYQADRILALAVIRSDHPQAMQRLDRLTPRSEDSRLLETRIRAALSRQAWESALSWIQALPQDLASEERWRYWQARSLEALGDKKQARTLYQALSKERSYYGFLAADRIGREYRLNHTPLTIPSDRLTTLSSRMGLRRAGELFALGRFSDARREWRMAVADLDRAELQTAAKLAQNWGWHEQAIFTLARTHYWDDLELRFPVEHQQKIDREAARQQLNNAWVYAVVRQESAFASDARSSAGALGLMQLMPYTARYTARQINQRRPALNDLLRPETNIRLGTAYLRHVLGRLNDHPVLATAAYNAGPHRVSQWLPERTLPADIWVETIPFKETRRYTQRVLTYAVIYDQRLGNKVIGLDQRMPPVQPQNTSVAEGLGEENPTL